jgi:hypothetical protein
MTARRAGRRRGMLTIVRWGGAVTAAFALAALVATGPASGATSGTDYNQMTGVGSTASAVTVNWTAGLLNSSNKAITTNGTELSPNSDREAYASGKSTSPLKFMYSDFDSLQVKVSQTENIGHQGITVTWTGGEPSSVSTTPQDDFLQMMECWGDASTGPSPDDCEYGSHGMLASGAVNTPIGDRGGLLCNPGSVADPGNPATGPGGPETLGCDPEENPTAQNPSDCDPAGNANGVGCSQGYFYVPFVPVDDPTAPIYEQQNLPTDFSEFNSNEVQEATTAGSTTANSSGQQQFETLTNVQAPHLGCGEIETNGQTRDCWLVIVPRGTYEPNGYQVQGTNAQSGFLQTSPLTPSNWAQRIQVHLGYAPLATSCPPTVVPTLLVGTQVISRALLSWELALNLAAKCSRVYAFTPSTEGSATDQLSTPTPGNAGLAFTTIPIGSENTRYPGGTAPKLPKILYAPVAVTALDYGFNIDEGPAGYVTTPVNLTPSLAAKAMTQVYRFDLPDVDLQLGLTGPTWAAKNPSNITLDPAFTKLNPVSKIPQYQLSSIPLAPLLTVDASALNQQYWQWIQTDPATSAWLDGTKSASETATADPSYTSLDLGKTPAIDSFPRAYTGKLDLGPCPLVICTEEDPTNPIDEILNTTDLLPEYANYDSASSAVLAANDTTESQPWCECNRASNGTPGWWSSAGHQAPGYLFMWTASDMPDLAAYGLIPANLCNASGSSCVGPSLASVGKALGSAAKDSAGLLEVNPAKVPAGGYPLTDVVYAAVPTNEPAAALSDYADFISYAAGAGQTAGSSPGDLPPGYLPMTSALQKQARGVVAELRALAGPTTKSSPTPTHSAGATSSAAATSSQTPPTTAGGGAETPNPTAASASSTSTSTGAAASSSPSAGGPVISPPSAVLVSGTTPVNSAGNIRLALIVVLIIGAAGALGGSVLRFAHVPQANPLRRRRPRRSRRGAQ